MARANQEQATERAEERFYSKLGIPTTSLKGAVEAIEVNRYTNNVICLVGEAGVGKTQCIKQIAGRRKPTEPFEWHGRLWENEVPVVTMYLAHKQAEDIGVPYPSRAKRNELLRECELCYTVANLSKNLTIQNQALVRAEKLADFILNQSATLEDGTFEFLIEKNLKDMPQEGILFLDEWNRADKSVIKAFFTLLEDREVHGVKVVPPGVQIAAAMNPSDSAYSVNETEKDHAFRRRLSFVAVTSTVGEWIEYASGPGQFHRTIVDFIKAMPAYLHDVKIRNAGKAYPCPATWEKVSNILKNADRQQTPLVSRGVHLAVCGHIGEAAGETLAVYIQKREIVINPEDVLFRYTEKSEVRKRVLQLVEGGRNDALDELCSGLAGVLFGNKPEVSKLSRSLALFMGDIKPETAVAFVAHKMTAEIEGSEGGDAYLGELSKALQPHECYRRIYDRIGEAMKKGDSANEAQ